MLILLVRHAHAGEHDPVRYPDDTQRPITARGRTVHREVSEALRQRKLLPDAIFASPWKRAWQSAEIMAQVMGRKHRPLAVQAAPSLARAPDLSLLQTELNPADETATLALVGHEPWLGTLASLLLTGNPHSVAVDFPKSGVLGIETRSLEPGAGMLRFFLRPKMMRKGQ